MRPQWMLIILSIFCCAEFRKGNAPILVATDVASRGLGLFKILCFFSYTGFSLFNASS